MADVFISYKRDERQAVERLAAKLRELGLNIWFDASMSAGETFNSEIDREARAAKAILVCWSPTARESRWVIAEAMIGFEQDKLAACHVAGPDGFSPPTPFNTSHAEDLRAWLAAPSETHAGWRSVLRRIGKLCGRPDIESWGALDAQASAAELRAWIGAHEQSPLFMAVETVLRAREEQDAERARLEQEARARRAREEAERRAKEQAERLAREEAERVRAQAERERRELEQRQEATRARVAELDEAERARKARRAPGLGWILFACIAVVGVFFVFVALNQGQPGPPAPSPASSAQSGNRAGEGVGGPGQEFRDCADCPEMVVVPAGSFLMGSPDSETGRNSDEGPLHQVSVQSFAASKYEVTFAQWGACVADGGCGGYQPPDQGWGRGNRPVINVSWNDAQEYVRWLSREARHNYRLLTEAEWEYAARAGTTTAYSTGASISASQARFSSQSTAAVGSFPANAFGLYDMQGNIWEWVEDCYAESYAGHQSDGSAYETNNCSQRVLRGGSWFTNRQYLRSANRNWNGPTNRDYVDGFRLARTL